MPTHLKYKYYTDQQGKLYQFCTYNSITIIYISIQVVFVHLACHFFIDIKTPHVNEEAFFCQPFISSNLMSYSIATLTKL